MAVQIGSGSIQSISSTTMRATSSRRCNRRSRINRSLRMVQVTQPPANSIGHCEMIRRSPRISVTFLITTWPSVA